RAQRIEPVEPNPLALAYVTSLDSSCVDPSWVAHHDGRHSRPYRAIQANGDVVGAHRARLADSSVHDS
ncbi:MAG: hypothetical protein R3B96_11955, partial [Pirellulaceae bacterium]